MQEKQERWLMHHPESDSIFEVYTQEDLENCESDGCDDVTGVEKYEKAFREEGCL